MSTARKKYFEDVVPKMVDKYKYKNKLEIPKIEKIVINRGLGEATANSKVVGVAADALEAIAGQKAVITKAKKSISNFKLREGQAIGCKVTLRSDRMYDFITKLFNVALPKIRDFRGVPVKAFDGRGNYNLGVKEEIIFPEVDYSKLDRIRGMNITFVTTAKTNEECRDLLAFMGMPFRKH